MQWIKLDTDLFDNRKIKYIRRKEGGDEMVLLWVMLLTLAGRCDYAGKIYLTEQIPYTAQMLADDLSMSLQVVQQGLELMEQLGMLGRDEGAYYIVGWSDHQSVEEIERRKAMNRRRVARYRNKQKEKDKSITCNADVMQCNATEENREEKNRKEKSREEENRKRCQSVTDRFNDLCPSFVRVEKLSSKQMDAILLGLEKLTVEHYERAFRKAEASEFLKGDNARRWKASFDWLIQPDNLHKVLSGNYDGPVQKKSEYVLAMEKEILNSG